MEPIENRKRFICYKIRMMIYRRELVDADGGYAYAIHKKSRNPAEHSAVFRDFLT